MSNNLIIINQHVQRRLHHSSFGANAPWKILGKHLSQSWGEYWSSKFSIYHIKCHSKCNRWESSQHSSRPGWIRGRFAAGRKGDCVREGEGGR